MVNPFPVSMPRAKSLVSVVAVCMATGHSREHFWVDVSSLAASLVAPLPRRWSEQLLHHFAPCWARSTRRLQYKLPATGKTKPTWARVNGLARNTAQGEVSHY